MSEGGNHVFCYENRMGGCFPPFTHGFQVFHQNPRQSTNYLWKPSASNNPGYPFPVANKPRVSIPTSWNSRLQLRLPFLETLNLQDLLKIINGPVCHYPNFPMFPNKLPSNIPKFEGKYGEDPGDHVKKMCL
jgi:hypothetical protein